MNTIIYARFSPRPEDSVSDTEDPNDKQLIFCREHAQKQSWTIRHEFKDEMASGAEEDRPGLWDALDATRKGFVLLAYHPDRLARSVFLMETIKREIENKKARLAFVAGAYEPTDEGIFVQQVFAAFAEYQRKIFAKRTAAAMRRHQHNGRRMSDKTPYGTKRDPNDPTRLIIDESEQQMIKLIKELHAEGKGLRQIARLLQPNSCRGGQWHHSTIANILERYKEKSAV